MRWGHDSPGRLSAGEYGARVGIPRILGTLEKYDIKATFFVPAVIAMLHPNEQKRVIAEGHEIGHHGWVHENPAKLEPAYEREVMERGFEALDHAVGIRPIGYRTAAWDFSPQTIDLMEEYGLQYSSSCMANDFYPYYLRKGDRWSPTTPYEFGTLTEIVEIAPSWGLDDFPPLEYVWGANAGPMTPSQVYELWSGEFDYMVENCPGGVFNLTCHPDFIGRGSRITMFDRLIAHMKGSGVRFERLRDVALRFREENPLDVWASANPHRTGATARNAPGRS